MKQKSLVLFSFMLLAACATTNRGPAASLTKEPCPLSDFNLLESRGGPNANLTTQHNQAMNARNLCLASQASQR